MIDISIGLGTGKMLSLLARNARHHQLGAAAPDFQRVHCIAVSVAASWSGESIAALLQRVLLVMGRPTADLKDCGSELHKAIGLLAEHGLARPSIDDISHAVANRLTRRDQDHPMCSTFVSACGRVSSQLKHTGRACLGPPKVQSKSRFMPLHRLVTWADRLLPLSPARRAQAGSMLATLRACLDQLPACRVLITQFRDDAIPWRACQKMLTTQGLTHDTLTQCDPLIDTRASVRVRREFTRSLQCQLAPATTLGLDEGGWPISSDPSESLCGLAQQHGVGETQDAKRIALRLPALCGLPTREEAQQVLTVSVARQQAITDGFTALTKQRREVLPNPQHREKLGRAQAQTNVELIPRPKNRSNHQESIYISNGYKEIDGPGQEGQDGHSSPESDELSDTRVTVSTC